MKLLTKPQIKRKFKEFRRENEIYVMLENIQYATNVAQAFRTMDAAGVRKVFLVGMTTKPPFGKDLAKTSRSKEKSLNWEYHEKSEAVVNKLKSNGFKFISVELTENAKDVSEIENFADKNQKICIVVGNEVHGVKKTTIADSDLVVAIPMYGRGASLNVAVSLAIALYSF